MRRPSATTKPCFLSTMILSPLRTSGGIQVYSLPVSTSVSGNDRAGSRRSRFWISIVVRMSPASSTVAPSLRSAETFSLLSASNLCEERQHTVTFPRTLSHRARHASDAPVPRHLVLRHLRGRRDLHQRRGAPRADILRHERRARRVGTELQARHRHASLARHPRR